MAYCLWRESCAVSEVYGFKNVRTDSDLIAVLPTSNAVAISTDGVVRSCRTITKKLEYIQQSSCPALQPPKGPTTYALRAKLNNLQSNCFPNLGVVLLVKVLPIRPKSISVVGL